MCSKEKVHHQYGRRRCAVRRRHTISTDAGVQYGHISHIISTNEGVQYRSTKTAQGVVGGCIYLGE